MKTMQMSIRREMNKQPLHSPTTEARQEENKTKQMMMRTI